MSGGQLGYPNFEDQVALGMVPGFELVSRWHEETSTTNIQSEFTNSSDTIRILPSAAAAISIVSSSAEDGAGTSTGVLSVHVYYLDANWLEQSEVVTLNGTGAVTTTGTAIRFLAAHSESVGSAGAAVGNINFSIGGNSQSRILATQNETREAAYACPDNKMIYIRSIEFFTGRSPTVDLDIAVEVRDAGEDIWYTVFSGEVYQGAIDFDDFRLVMGPRDDIRVLGTASGSGGPSAAMRIHGWKVDKNMAESMGSRYVDNLPNVAR